MAAHTGGSTTTGGISTKTNVLKWKTKYARKFAEVGDDLCFFFVLNFVIFVFILSDFPTIEKGLNETEFDWRIQKKKV